MFNPITPLNHYSIENPASIYDEEAMTALELAGRTAGKVNEIANRVNEHGEYITESIEKQDAVIEQMVNVDMPKAVDREVLDHIQDGDFDNQISEYAGNLSKRVDNLLGAVQVGGTTADAELIDIRTTVNNVVYPSAGNAVRSIGADVNELRRGRYNIKYALDWDLGKGMDTYGNLHTNVSASYGVAHHRFPKGTKIEYTLFTTVNSGTVAIGTEEKPVSCIRIGEEYGTPTTGVYTVTNDWETVWFMTDTSKIGECIIAVSQEKPETIKWYKGFVKYDGSVDASSAVYHHTDPIFVPAMHKLSFIGQASGTVSVISLCDKSGTFIMPVAMGRDGLTRNEYMYVSAKDSYVRLCTSVQFRDDHNNSTLINNIELKIEPYADKVRKPVFAVGGGHINVSQSKVVNDSVYQYTDKIMLFAGETIRVKFSGSSSSWGLSEWDYDPSAETAMTFKRGIFLGDDRFHEQEFTNNTDRPIYVRVSAKKVATPKFNIIVPEAEFAEVLCYYKDVYYADVKNHPLYGKTLTLIGDSLAYGNRYGNGIVWANLLGLKYNMTVHNLGVNGSSVAEGSNGMVSRFNQVPASDYIVLIGGANDLRLDVPLATFKQALTTIIEGLRALHPKTKLLFLTNMNRYGSTNTIGVNERDYVDAMLEVCGDLGVRCFDNYRNLGLYFRDVNQSIWADEEYQQCLEFGDSASEATFNKHLSREAYKWILPVYENILTGL